MKGAKHILLFLSFLSLSILAEAGDHGISDSGNTEPVLHGNITDAVTKKPVAGVLVSIRVARTNEKTELTTDASGNFQLPRMPAGEVTIILEKKGYRTIRREKVLIREGISMKLDLDLKLERAGEEIDFFHPMMRMMEGN